MLEPWDPTLSKSVQSYLWRNLLQPQHRHIAAKAQRVKEPFRIDTIALVTRDALGWFLYDQSEPFLREGHELQSFGAAPDGCFWPMLWLRPVVSAHDTLERMQRLRADLDFATRLSPHSIAPEGLIAEPICL